MPGVTVRYKDGSVSGVVIDSLVTVLPLYVARALSVEGSPETNLTLADIEVWASPLGPHDLQEADVSIVVDANDYKSRRAIVQRAAQQVRDAVDELFRQDETSGEVMSCVWIRLLPAGFAESHKK